MVDKIFYGDDKMYHILICDDELPTCTYIEHILLNHAKKEKIKISIESFITGEDLLQHMKDKCNIDLIFLDIELCGENGAIVGKMLREDLLNESVQIVFISSHEEYALQLFKVRPFDFLIKPLNKEMIIHIFEKYRRIYDCEQKFFEYKVSKHVEKVLLTEIMYFACEQRKICIVTKRGKEYFYGSMRDLHANFHAKGFLSVHNSYIINVKYVKFFRENEIVMCDDSVISVSNAYKREVKKEMMQLNED